jgi:CheY-like chemotaxis protein
MNAINVLCLIDDDQIYQLTTRRLLEKHKLATTILPFQEAERALEYLKKHAREPELLPDVIFLDINMPHMDGWEFLEAYTQIKTLLAKPITIFVVSSSINHGDITRAKSNSEVTDYLVKPINQQVIMHSLGQITR